MKIFITHIMRLSGTAGQAAKPVHLASVKEQMALIFIVVDSGARERVSTCEPMFELFHWCQREGAPGISYQLTLTWDTIESEGIGPAAVSGQIAIIESDTVLQHHQ